MVLNTTKIQKYKNTKIKMGSNPFLFETQRQNKVEFIIIIKHSV
jgi:hypothetical protein